MAFQTQSRQPQLSWLIGQGECFLKDEVWAAVVHQCGNEDKNAILGFFMKTSNPTLIPTLCQRTANM